jgi:hypothetical protein
MQLGPLFTDMILTLAVLPNGDVVAGGAFTNVASRIARWNGTSWLPLGSGMDDSVFDLLVLPGGDLLAAGLFTNAGGVQASNVARWNGSTWSALGAGPGGIARTLALLPNGDVLAGGSFGGGIALSRWNGSWSPVATSSPGPAVVLELRADGSVVTGHLASFTGSTALGYLRMASTTCPATATAYGAGCAGSAGPMVLTATALPWVGSVCHTRCVGFAPLSVGIVAAGMGQLSLPLALVLPSAGAGCSVLARPDVLELRFPVAGAVNWQLTVPNVPSLVGTQVHHQMAQLELDAGLQIVGSASSQALTLTVGVF